MPRHRSLAVYKAKRDFKKTREPSGRRRVSARPIFVVQEHHARRLHWDFRLESEGVLKSWAVTSMPDLNPMSRHLAIETEDHPWEYATFSGTIPPGEYGAGRVIIWDYGTFLVERPLSDMIDDGVVKVTLKGRKLRGRFVLVRTEGEGEKSRWLFFKAKPRVVGLKVPELKKRA